MPAAWGEYSRTLFCLVIGKLLRDFWSEGFGDALACWFIQRSDLAIGFAADEWDFGCLWLRLREEIRAEEESDADARIECSARWVHAEYHLMDNQ